MEFQFKINLKKNNGRNEESSEQSKRNISNKMWNVKSLFSEHDFIEINIAEISYILKLGIHFFVCLLV